MKTSRIFYLGDSVYVDHVNGMLRLTTDNGHGPTNTIYLDPDVFDSLMEYVVQMRRDMLKGRKIQETPDDRT